LTDKTTKTFLKKILNLYGKLKNPILKIYILTYYPKGIDQWIG